MLIRIRELRRFSLEEIARHSRAYDTHDLSTEGQGKSQFRYLVPKLTFLLAQPMRINSV
jgi:hypothetical protein